MAKIILDCYTDEPAGLGVPPYLGTYPRYLYGYLKQNHPDEEIFYLTIDDLRLLAKHNNTPFTPKPSQKTNISIYNLTKNSKNIQQILNASNEMFIIVGVHVPGKYLSALPGTIRELKLLLGKVKETKHIKKILTGPAIYGTQLEGGKSSENINIELFQKVWEFAPDYKDVAKFVITGANLLQQIPDIRIMELETGSGCISAKCSFCTEPIKSKLIFRETDDIIKEAKALYNAGARYFRLGKQTCFYSIPEPSRLLKEIREQCPELKVLHIDNVNPMITLSKKGLQITKDIVKYCTEGNIAAFGIECFDKDVARVNKLNCKPDRAYEAIKFINEHGRERGPNGMPKFLPGINILFGLIGETKKTQEENMRYLKQILEDNLLIRRINIRQVAVFEGTLLEELGGTKFIRKNKKYYYKWRKQIREEIDAPMLKRLVPKGTILRDIYTEIYDGKTTFGRHIGTYPLTIGIKGRLPLKKFVTVKVTKHQLRSITAEVVEE